MSLDSRRGSRLEDPGADLLDRIGALWTDYGRIALGVIGVVIAVVVVTIFVQRGQKANEEAAAARLAEASLYFWQGDYARSQQLALQVTSEYGSTYSGTDAHRLLGDNAFWTGDYKAAIEAYRTYLAKEKTGLLSDAVRRSLAYTLETDGQSVEAAETYLSLVGKFDRESDAEFLVAAGRCYMAAGQNDAARTQLQALADEYGETSYARRGREMLAEIDLLSGSASS